MTLFPLSVVIAVLFFIVLPAVSSLYSLLKFRKIRHRVVHSAAAEVLGEGTKEGTLCRFWGKFEGFKDDNEIWVRSEEMVVRVKLKNCNVIFMSEKVNKAERGFWGGRIPGGLRILKWRKFITLSTGMKIFLYGRPRKEGTVFEFDGEEKDSLVVFYTGENEGLDRELVLQAKNRYSYFRNPSFSFLVLGSIFLFILSVMEYQRVEFGYTFFLTFLLAAFPVLFFIPPGCLLFLLSYRIKYSIFLLRHDYYFHYFNVTGVKPDSKTYRRRVQITEVAAVCLAAASIIVNFLLWSLVIYFLLP